MSGLRGVLYVAAGAAHLQAAAASARSVRQTNPALGIAVFTDRSCNDDVFDAVHPVSEPHKRSKVDYLGAAPFDEVLYLDTDTRVYGELGTMFRLLERFDLAVAQRQRPVVRRKSPKLFADVPASFPEHNGGVLLYRRSPEMLAFLDAWRTAYHEAGLTADQRSFREALWTSSIRFAVLPVRYNTRRFTWLDWMAAGGRMPDILHVNRFNPAKRGGAVQRALSRLAGPGL